MKHRRRNFLIDKPFQLRFSLYVVTWMMALGLTFPLVINNLVETLIQVLRVSLDGPGLEQIRQLRDEVNQQLWITMITLTGVIFLISIFVSHRIAGPLYKLKLHLAELGKGNIDQNLKFRKSDYFHSLADDYNKSLAGLRATFGKNKELTQEAISKLEKSDVQEALKLLRQIR